MQQLFESLLGKRWLRTPTVQRPDTAMPGASYLPRAVQFLCSLRKGNTYVNCYARCAVPGARSASSGFDVRNEGILISLFQQQCPCVWLPAPKLPLPWLLPGRALGGGSDVPRAAPAAPLRSWGSARLPDAPPAHLSRPLCLPQCGPGDGRRPAKPVTGLR